MGVVANWRKVQCKAQLIPSPVLIGRFCQKMMKGSIDIRPRHFSAKVPEIFVKTRFIFSCPKILLSL